MQVGSCFNESSFTIPIRIEILRLSTYKALENHLRDTTAKRGVV